MCRTAVATTVAHYRDTVIILIVVSDAVSFTKPKLQQHNDEKSSFTTIYKFHHHMFEEENNDFESWTFNCSATNDILASITYS
ncbi:unnamed protein product [Wuchereria bancrofti]|uniref:Uncharacterized protein n=1 Tax=Wuchereria bancrofti TaxID=6293 RepID=A0A3P7DD15_WUCBA|nr:unnamed protein product [Wuchereria bancrofti]